MVETITVRKSEYDSLKRKAAAYDKLSKGNSVKGKASAASMTPEQLSARAKKAVEARIKKYGQARRSNN